MQQQTPLTSEICMALMRIGTRMAVEFDHQFADLGINQAQFRILLAVWSEGGLTGIQPSALADHLFIERGTVSVMSGRMIKLGWLERLPGPDRRSHLLRLTQAGGQMLERCAPRAIGLGDLTFEGFSRPRLEAMLANLNAIETELRNPGSQGAKP
jgi:DNA-binding MarR family transcriptional regulator